MAIERKRVLGVPIPDERDREREIRRSHPGAEDTDRPGPPPEPPRKPQYKRSYTPYDLELIRPEDANPPRVERGPLPELEPRSRRRSFFPPSGDLPPWAKGIIGIIGALASAVTGGIIVWATRAPAAKPADVVQVRAQARDADKAQNDYLESIRRDDIVKDAIRIALMCKLNNGQPPAAGIECPTEKEARCEERQVIRDGKPVPKQFYCHVPLRWPDPRLPPK